jgi:ferritin-like metal-binding protein YciE
MRRKNPEGLAEDAACSRIKGTQGGVHDARGTDRSTCERLEQVFELLEKPTRGKTCEAIEGITEDEDIAEEFKGTPALDAGLISAAGSGALRDDSLRHAEALGARVGMKDVAGLFDKTLKEETMTHELLTKLAEVSANARAKAP